MMPFYRQLPLLVLFAWTHANAAESISVDEVKASYVFNFVKFAEWPDNIASNGLTLCVVGNEAMAKTLAKLDGGKVQEHILHVKQNMQYGDNLNVCNVVVIGESARHKEAAIINTLDNAPVLTISSIDGFAEKGGCIGLLYRGNRVLFEVNLEALRRTRIQLPAQVLNLAVNVFGE